MKDFYAQQPNDLYCRFSTRCNTVVEMNLPPDNAKCAQFYTKEQNGLLQDWGGERVFCNPPYGKVIADWVRKCSEEAKKPNTIVVALLPARTDTRYFHEYIYRKAKDVQFVKGRLKFGDCKSAAPFPSMVVIF